MANDSIGNDVREIICNLDRIEKCRKKETSRFSRFCTSVVRYAMLFAPPALIVGFQLCDMYSKMDKLSKSCFFASMLILLIGGIISYIIHQITQSQIDLNNSAARCETYNVATRVAIANKIENNLPTLKDEAKNRLIDYVISGR